MKSYKQILVYLADLSIIPAKAKEMIFLRRTKKNSDNRVCGYRKSVVSQSVVSQYHSLLFFATEMIADGSGYALNLIAHVYV